MSETDGDSLLRANAEFYRAFAAGELAAIDALWARAAPVSCIHPGWQGLFGRDAVIESWRAILGRPPAIRMLGARAHVLGSVGYVTCIELIGESVLVATNIFARENGDWKLVHHQAGPSAEPIPSAEDDPVRLH